LSNRRKTWLLAVLTLTAAAVVAFAVTGYGMAAAPPAAHLPIQAPKKCGDPVIFKKSDPDGVLAKLPKSVLPSYYSYYSEVHSTPWTNFKGKKPPWKIGFINFPVDNPWQVGLTSELKTQFALAKKKGLVDGDLQIYIQPDWATATPDQQIAAIQQMVKSGVDAIILHALNEVAETKAIDEAGKAGVPVIMSAAITPGSKYVVNDMTVNQVPGIVGFLKLYNQKGWFKGETRNAIEVRGVQGNVYEQTIHDTWVAATKPCKNIKLVGTVWGNWSGATTKAEMLKFLSSYTGKVDFIEHGGAMAGGVIEAYDSLGRPVPPMQISGTTGGDLAWWCANKSKYDTVGYHFSGRQVAYTTFDIAMRMLSGKGLMLRDLAFPGVKATNANICQLATPGKDVSWIGDIRAPVNGWAGNPKNLDYFFKKPGSPLHGPNG